MTTVTRYGENSVLVEKTANPLPLVEFLKTVFPEATLRPGLESILITFKDSADHTELVRKALPNKELRTNQTAGKRNTIKATYEGEDLEEVAKILEITTEELISLHQSTKWRVALIGFAPGFPYLVPLTKTELFQRIGRLETPRTSVPKGSIGLAAGMSCIYPENMPGGWHLIAQTEQELFDSKNQINPTLLEAGDIVLFERSV